MIYLQKSRNSRKRPFWATLGIVFAAVLLVWMLQRFAGGFVSRIALRTGGPVASGYVSVENKFSFMWDFFHSHSSLVEENKKLQAEIDADQTMRMSFDTLQREHEQLLTAYNRSPFAGKVILGNVISKPPQSPYDVLVIDIGSAQGILVGDQIYAVGGIPLGKIIETTKNSSKAVLFSSVGEENQMIDERTGSTLSVLGIGGGNLQTQVAQEMDITIGDAITLPQFGGAVVGSVIAVDTSVASSFKRILFRVPVNVFNIRWVEVLKQHE